MAGIKNVHLGAGHVASVGVSFFDLERRVEATPQDEERWLAAARPLLSRRIARDVGCRGVHWVHSSPLTCD